MAKRIDLINIFYFFNGRVHAICIALFFISCCLVFSTEAFARGRHIIRRDSSTPPPAAPTAPPADAAATTTTPPPAVTPPSAQGDLSRSAAAVERSMRDVTEKEKALAQATDDAAKQKAQADLDAAKAKLESDVQVHRTNQQQADTSPSPSVREARSPANDSESNAGSSNAKEDYNFSNNSLGKAGEKVAAAIKSCGSESGQAACEASAHRLETMSKISTYSDYASYAAVAGTIGPTIIFAGTNQKKDLELAAKIQEVSGIANLAAGAVDLSIGAQARFGEAGNLQGVKTSESTACDPYDKNENYANPADPNQKAMKGVCSKFNRGRKLNGAIEEVKNASTSHFLIGGLKAVGGAAALWLASESRKNAQKLDNLNTSTNTSTNTQTQTSTNTSTTALQGPVATPTNAVGFLPTVTTDSNAQTNSATPRALASGASVAPLVNSPIRRNNDDPSLLGNSRRSGGSGGNSGGPGATPLSLNIAAHSGSEDVKKNDLANGEKEGSADWSGGGGSLNNRGVDLAGGGDGGFANLLGAMTNGILGGDKGAAAAPPVEAGLIRNPAEEHRGNVDNTHGPNNPDIDLFQRVSGAIDRQQSAGNLATSTGNTNKT